MKTLITLFALFVLLAPPAAADIFAYKTDDGVFSYTDDRGKIPAKYRAGATVVPAEKDAKQQITIVGPEASAVSARQALRLQALRASNDADRAAARETKAKAEAMKPASPTIIIIQPRVERHGFPQRNRHHNKGA